MNRAQFLAGLAGLVATGIMPARADTPLELGWGDLIPGGGEPALPINLGPHNELAGKIEVPYDNADDIPIRTDLDGQLVKIVGYMVPIAYAPGSGGSRVSGFLLAPFIGACVHVPPPPANQIVLGTFEPGIEISLRIWVDPVVAIGRMTAKTIDVDLAKVGYQIEADSLDFYKA